jgi:hypothetical protein
MAKRTQKATAAGSAASTDDTIGKEVTATNAPDDGVDRGVAGGIPSGDKSSQPHHDRLPETAREQPRYLDVTRAPEAQSVRTVIDPLPGDLSAPADPENIGRIPGGKFPARKKYETVDTPTPVRVKAKTYYNDVMYEPGAIITGYVGTIGRTLEKVAPSDLKRMREFDADRERAQRVAAGLDDDDE